MSGRADSVPARSVRSAIPSVALAALCALSASASAQRGYPGNFRPMNIAVGGTQPVAFFAANDGNGAGVEPWSYASGPGALPRRLADIEPGPPGSFPDQFTPISGTQVFFTARTCSGTPGCVADRELYFHDTGTSTTTKLDVRPGADGSFPTGLTRVGSQVFFSADDGTNGRELWVSDGTPTGTTMVADIAAGAASSCPHDLIVLGTEVLFAATDGAGDTELWKSDGTPAGTSLVADIHMTGSSFPGEMAELGGVVFFAATTAAEGRELWSTNGTTAGTALVQDLRPGSDSSAPDQLTPDPVNGALAFTAVDGTSGRTLWVHKPGLGTAAFPVSNGRTVANLAAMPIPDPLCAFWFTYDQPSVGVELAFASSLGVIRVPRDATPPGSDPTSLRPTATGVLFRADDGTTGQEPWRWDGTGFTALGDLKTGSTLDGPKSSFASPMVPFGSEFLFAAEDNANGLELWTTDGTPGGTHMVADMATDTPTFTTHLTTGSVRVDVSDVAVGMASGALLVGFAPMPTPTPLIGGRGALLLDHVYAQMFTTNGSGNATTSFQIPPNTTTIPPVGFQSVLFFPTVQFSNLDPYSLGECSDPATGLAAKGEGIVCDETGEYKITIRRTDSVRQTAYFALVYVNAAGEYQMVKTGDDTGDGSFSLEPGESVDLHGFVDLYSADESGDVSGTKSVEVRLLSEPPTPANVGRGCTVWTSYC